MIDKISAGPITVFLIGAHTNFAIFLMSNPQLKKNVEHIYVMGGGVRSKNPTGCCPENATSCVPRQCGDPGNVFTDYTSNPYAEFNFLGDPFAAYQVILITSLQSLLRVTFSCQIYIARLLIMLSDCDSDSHVRARTNLFSLPDSQSGKRAFPVFRLLEKWLHFLTVVLIFQVIHSGIPVTLVPLDATNTIPISQNFFEALEKSRSTYEAQYIFQSLKMARDTWFDNQFYTVSP